MGLRNHALDTQATLLACLQQQDAVLVRVRATQGSVPREAGAWLAVLGGCFSGRVIGEDGSEGRGIRDEDRAQALEVRVLRDRGADLTSVRPFLARHRRRCVDLFVAALIVNVTSAAPPMPTAFSGVQVRAGLYLVVTRRCRGSIGVHTGAPRYTSPRPSTR